MCDPVLLDAVERQAAALERLADAAEAANRLQLHQAGRHVHCAQCRATAPVAYATGWLFGERLERPGLGAALCPHCRYNLSTVAGLDSPQAGAP